MENRSKSLDILSKLRLPFIQNILWEIVIIVIKFGIGTIPVSLITKYVQSGIWFFAKDEKKNYCIKFESRGNAGLYSDHNPRVANFESP